MCSGPGRKVAVRWRVLSAAAAAISAGSMAMEARTLSQRHCTASARRRSSNFLVTDAAKSMSSQFSAFCSNLLLVHRPGTAEAAVPSVVSSTWHSRSDSWKVSLEPTPPALPMYPVPCNKSLPKENSYLGAPGWLSGLSVRLLIFTQIMI